MFCKAPFLMQPNHASVWLFLLLAVNFVMLLLVSLILLPLVLNLSLLFPLIPELELIVCDKPALDEVPQAL